MKSQVVCTAATALVLAFGLGQHAFALDKTPALSLDLALGNGAASYLTSDLSYDYVRINAEYRS